MITNTIMTIVTRYSLPCHSVELIIELINTVEFECLLNKN